MEWIDTHAHLNDERFAERVDSILQQAHAVGVSQTLVIGIDLETSRSAVALAAEHLSLYAVVGIQPNSLDRVQPDDWDQILRLAREPKVVGIGESGLDQYWDFAPIQLQREYFFRHLQLSHELELPIVIHCRDAEQEVVEVLEQFAGDQGGPISGVMHSFTGSTETAKRCLELGLHISFAGMVTFKKNETLRETAATVPLDRILVETDSPYLAPHPLRGKENQPAYVVHTGACLAQVHGVDVEEFARITTQNACRLFHLPSE